MTSHDALRPTPDAPDQPREGWSVTDMGTAAWAARKAATAAREIETLKAWAADEKARIDAVLALETSRHQNDLDFFQLHLDAYLGKLIADGRETKSLALPHGTIARRGRQADLTIDEEAFLTWAKDTRPDLVRTKREVDKVALKKAAKLAEDGVVTVDGEIVESVTWTQQADSVSFKPAYPAPEPTGGNE